MKVGREGKICQVVHNSNICVSAHPHTNNFHNDDRRPHQREGGEESSGKMVPARRLRPQQDSGWVLLLHGAPRWLGYFLCNGIYYCGQCKASVAFLGSKRSNHVLTLHSIVADTGGTCVCNGGDADPICDTNEEYLLCANGVKRDLITATAAISALASFCMGLFANL